MEQKEVKKWIYLPDVGQKTAAVVDVAADWGVIRVLGSGREVVGMPDSPVYSRAGVLDCQDRVAPSLAVQANPICPPRTLDFPRDSNRDPRCRRATTETKDKSHQSDLFI